MAPKLTRVHFTSKSLLPDRPCRNHCWVRALVGDISPLLNVPRETLPPCSPLFSRVLKRVLGVNFRIDPEVVECLVPVLVEGCSSTDTEHAARSLELVVRVRTHVFHKYRSACHCQYTLRFTLSGLFSLYLSAAGSGWRRVRKSNDSCSDGLCPRAPQWIGQTDRSQARTRRPTSLPGILSDTKIRPRNYGLDLQRSHSSDDATTTLQGQSGSTVRYVVGHRH